MRDRIYLVFKANNALKTRLCWQKLLAVLNGWRHGTEQHLLL